MSRKTKIKKYFLSYSKVKVFNHELDEGLLGNLMGTPLFTQNLLFKLYPTDSLFHVSPDSSVFFSNAPRYSCPFL
jgi:hypothetical protein